MTYDTNHHASKAKGQRHKITLQALKQWVRQAQQDPAKKKLYRWDSELVGFGVYVSPHGTVSWLVQKWTGGREGRSTRKALGQWPAMSLEDARRQALQVIGDVAKGIDIVDRKAKARQAKAEAIQAPTLQEASELYLRRLASRRSEGY